MGLVEWSEDELGGLNWVEMGWLGVGWDEWG